MIRFRLNAAAAVAAAIAVIGAIPLATYRWYLAPAALIPAVISVWAWRSGTDADSGGVVVRALLGSRRVPWSSIEALAADERGQVYARLSGSSSLRLPAVTAADLPRLVAASGQDLGGAPRQDTPDDQ